MNIKRRRVCPHNGSTCIKKKANCENPAGTKYAAHTSKLQGASITSAKKLFKKDSQLQKWGLRHLRIDKDRRKKFACIKLRDPQQHKFSNSEKYSTPSSKLHITLTKGQTERRNFRFCLTCPAKLLLFKILKSHSSLSHDYYSSSAKTCGWARTEAEASFFRSNSNCLHHKNLFSNYSFPLSKASEGWENTFLKKAICH